MSLKKKGFGYTQIYAGAALALSTLLTVIFLGYQSLNDARTSNFWVTHTMGVISKIQEINTSVNELGITQRGYLLTAQEKHLVKYNATVPVLEKDLDDLRELTKDDQSQQSRIKHVKELIHELMKYHALNIESVRQGQTAVAVERVKAGGGQKTLDTIGQKLRELTAHEENLLEARLEDQKNDTRKSNGLIFSGSIFAFLLVLIAAYLVIQEFKRRTEIQRSLNKTSEVQKTILNSAAFALIATQPDGKIVLFNPAAEKLLGFTREEMFGKTPEIFHLKEEIKSMSQLLSERYGENIEAGHETLVYRAKKGIVESDQWTYVRKDGTHLPVSLSVTAQKNQDGEITGFLGIAFDISQQLEYERAIIKAKEQAVAGTEAKSEFLANMSHEIRTPMNAIMGMAELLNESDLDAEQRKYVDVFTRAGESLLNIINDILDLSKIEAGHFELDMAPFSLSSVIEKSSEIMALKAHQKQLEFAIDIDENLHDNFIGDSNRLRQVLLNLIGNAVKFTKSGEILLNLKGGKQSNHKREITIEVQDTGIGMTPEQLANLFERFNQADSSITKEYGGTGLGLNITKRLVELMDGTIEATSEIGIGTTFCVRICLQEDESPITEINPISLEDKKILIVDDTKTNRFILKKILDHQGAITYEAKNGESALEKIHEATVEKSPFDLILLDCRMPGIDGFKVAELIQGSELKGPLIMMLTSDNRPGDLAKSKMLGLKSYLVKPVLKKELLSEISRAMFREAPPEAVTQVKIENQIDSELNILLVDDNDENRLVIRSFLKKLPWKVDEAKNGQEALALYSSKRYDVILMDMQMPVMDGYSATREIRRIEKEHSSDGTPILALTAYALKEEIDKSLEAGCNGHLSKPIAKADLIKAIENNTREYKITIDKDLEDLIPEYLEKRSNELVSLKTALEKNDFPLIQAIGHKLRGSAGSYGFSDLSEIGKELEEKSKVMDATSINHALTQYQHYLKRIKVSFG